MCVLCVFVAAPNSPSSVEVALLKLLNDILASPAQSFYKKKEFSISIMKNMFGKETYNVFHNVHNLLTALKKEP